MNLRNVLLVFACGTAYAELPPVSGDGSGNPAVNTAPSTAALSSTYEMMKRIAQMQTEIQQLTGKVEEQTFQIEELKKQQKTMYTDFDDRIQNLENKSGAAVPPPLDAPADPSVPTDPSAAPPPAPTTLNLPSSSSQPQGSTPDKADKLSAAPTQEPAPAPAAATDTGIAQVPESEQQEYQQAYDDLRNGRTDRAITGFNAFIASHPGSGYASNAQYWLGEAHRVNQDNGAARKAFTAVIETYPNSAKVPDALLKLGYIEMEEKNPTKAKEIFTRVTTEFASSKAAGLAQKKMLLLDKSAL